MCMKVRSKKVLFLLTYTFYVYQNGIKIGEIVSGDDSMYAYYCDVRYINQIF